ncbi:MAG: lytic transglycosylase domain-containing protein [Actinobacteria bacterium]|nr:MAG: lytic transglycosylase domain-containing protein [Actinomycetota bacterium]
MSTHAANVRRRRARAPRSRASARKRLAAIALAALAGALLVTSLPQLRHAAREITLPLRHEDVIRQQAAEKGLDPSLIAAVIYAESRFADRTSRAGARGLMQLTPQTARAIAQRTGGVAFRDADLATPQVNISYGAWYLRHLLDHYGGNEVLALAAYNAGMGNVDRWLIQSGGGSMSVDDLPFPETRAYVDKVLKARAEYRRTYPRELGL